MELYFHLMNSLVAHFIEEDDFLPVRVTAAGGEQVTSHFFDPEITVAQEPLQFPPSNGVDTVIRPEAMEITGVSEEDTNVEILFSHYTGAVGLYAFSLPDKDHLEVQMINTKERGLRPIGTGVSRSPHRNDLHLLKKGS